MNAIPATTGSAEQPDDDVAMSAPSIDEDAFDIMAAAAVSVAGLAVMAWLIVTLITGLTTFSSWKMKTSTAVDAAARVETAASSLVGPVDDRYGVGAADSSAVLRIARHCDSEWSITYPRSAAEWLPPATTPVTVRVATSDRPTIDTDATIAGNGLTVSIPASEQLDAALFDNTYTTVTVTGSDGRQLSLTETGLRARAVTLWPLPWPNPLSYFSGRAHDPLSSLADVCG